MIRFILLLAITASVIGCEGSVHIVDATNDARIQGGYRPGQVWRLRTDGYIVNSRDNGPELWTAADGVSQPDAIKVAAGSTVRIERLGYLLNPEHLPTPGSTSEVVWAYGTLTDAGGRQWTVCVLPSLHDGKPVAGTSLVVFPPDRGFLELESGE